MPNSFDIGAIGQGAAMDAAQGIIGAGMGLLLEKRNDKRQIKQQQKLTDMQMRANKQLAEFNYKQQMQMWEDTNFAAQRKQLEKAGLNPGLLYGMSGGGGATTAAAQAGAASGSNAPSGGGEIMGMLSQKMQLALLQAQKENIEADTEKKKTETTKTAGVDTELGKTQIANLTQGIENAKAQNILQKIQAQLQGLDFKIKEETMDASIYIVRNEAEKSLQELNILRNEGIISETTWQTKIDIVQAEYATILLQNQATKAGIELTHEQTKQVIQNIQTQIKQLQQGDRSLNQKDQDIIIDKTRNDLIEKGIEWGAASQVIGNLIGIMSKKKAGGK